MEIKKNEYILRFIWIQSYRIFYLLLSLFGKTRRLKVLAGVGFLVEGEDLAKFGFYRFQSFFVYCCHNDIDFT